MILFGLSLVTGAEGVIRQNIVNDSVVSPSCVVVFSAGAQGSGRIAM